MRGMQIFFHLTELSTRCLVKEKRMTEQLLTTPSFRVCQSITVTPYPKFPFLSQETIHSTKKSEKSSILFNKYEKLFSFVDMLDEQRNSSRSLRGNRSGSARGTKREATPIEVSFTIYIPFIFILIGILPGWFEKEEETIGVHRWFRFRMIFLFGSIFMLVY